MPQSVSIDSVLCRLEMKELEEAVENQPVLYEEMMTAMKMSLDMNNGRLAAKKKPIISLREFGLCLTCCGLSAIAASEEEDADDASS